MHLDLAHQRYHRDYVVRERRAVFVQNLWMDGLGYKLRNDYHRRFATLDYQEAKRRGAIDELLHYVFTRADFPAPPAATPAKPSDDRASHHLHTIRTASARRSALALGAIRVPAWPE